ncbi:MAG: methyltransferase family protein [Chloroflexota bacterium]
MTTTTHTQQPEERQLISPVLTVICLATMLLLNWLWPIAGPVTPPFNRIGLFVGAGGLALCLVAQRQFRKAGTTLYPFSKPAKLVTSGMFRYTRNPMYLGLAIFLTGAWLLLGSLSPLGVVVAFVLIADRWYIASEERSMASAFGKAYEAYRAKTPRWI